jgi:hypothetical protein
VKPLEGICSARALPLLGCNLVKGEEPVTGFLDAVGVPPYIEPPFPEKGPPALLDLRRRDRVRSSRCHPGSADDRLLDERRGCSRHTPGAPDAYWSRQEGGRDQRIGTLNSPVVAPQCLSSIPLSCRPGAGFATGCASSFKPCAPLRLASAEGTALRRVGS